MDAGEVARRPDGTWLLTSQDDGLGVAVDGDRDAAPLVAPRRRVLVTREHSLSAY